MAGEGWTSLLITGVAQRLHTAGVGTWRESGVYTAGEIGITVRGIIDAPDRIITIADYPVPTDLRGMQDHTIGLQFRLRGTTDPRVCADIGDAIFAELDSLGRVTLNTIAVVDAWRQSYTSLGQDAHKRWEASHNYYFAAMRATTTRTD